MKKSVVLLLSVFFAAFLPAEDDIFEKIKVLVAENYPEAVKIRRDLHLIPEPCLREEKTSLYIINYLRQLGLEVQTGIGKTGIKAVLRGTSDSPVIALRADMDALPLEEKTGLSFSSKNRGFMHACGHDVHMANLLISARILWQLRSKIPGTLVFIFQPCEEGNSNGLSGAHLMVRDGVLENPRVDAILGLHVMPDIPLGSVSLCPGPLMANVVFFDIKIKGKSSHGALPHQGIDAIYVSALAILQFQGIVSRLKDPLEKAVLSIGSIKGGTASNIIADSVELNGTVRTFSFELENQIEKQMRSVLEGLARIYGIEFEFNFNRAAQFVKNDPALTEVITGTFQQVIGKERVLTAEPQTIAEDFSVYSHKIPAVFFFLGAGTSARLHSPHFAVAEEAFKTGPLLFCSGAFALLNYFSTKR